MTYMYLNIAIKDLFALLSRKGDMEYIYFKIFLAAYFLQNTEGAGCNDYTGGVIRDYDFDYTTDSLTNAQTRLSNAEHNQNHRQVEFVLSENPDYNITCECGTVTMWQFFAWKPGTTIFYVLSGTEIVGKTSIYIGDQSIQNFFEVPLSMDMWIPVQSGYSLGFYTDDLPMITYRSRTSNPMYFNRNLAEKNVGDNVEPSGLARTNRRFAVAAYVIEGKNIAAYVIEAHPPMFVNAPFETTVYTHETGSVVYTASILDLDGGDVVTVTDLTNNAGFLFDPGSLTLTYQSTLAQNTYTIKLRATDGCPKADHSVTVDIVINLVNEGPSFTNLPASTTVVDSETAQRTIYTLTATDPSGDSLTCTLDSTNPASGPFTIRSVSNGVYNIIQSLNPGYTYTSEKYYDLRISCTDGATTVYSNFQVDVVKNEAPYYNAGSGYLPASISVERTTGATIYQLDFTDPESDSVTSFSVSCSASCPFSISATGEVTTNSVLDDEGYDLNINMRDSFGNIAGPYALSVVTSGRPYTHNADPIFVNLPTTIHVMEHTAVGTFLLKVLYTDENPTDTFTLAKTSTNTADTYFNFDTTTGIITVKADIDFETTGTGGWAMSITVNDGSETQHVTVTETVTFNIVNINEGITLTIANPSISAGETLNRGDAFSSPGISSTDIDAGDTAYYTMDCGADSKYFYLDTSTLDVKFAREYDMDSGFSGTATCNVTVRDNKGLSDSGLITLTINNINDHYPKFPQNIYVFFVSTTTTFFTEVTNMAATDADSDSFGSTAGTITYNFNPVNPTEDYFQLDVAGVLFVRNLTTYTANTYVFEVIASDSGGFTGTCTVTIIFRAATVTTTTSTERPLTFKDDYQNYIWLLLCAIGIFATMIIIVLMVWKDPIVNEYVNFKIYKLCLWCRKKPKPKEPRRTVGKLRVTVNKKDLENDPDNALPWELLAKDNEGPEVNEVQDMIEHRLEKKDREYKNFSGLPVFERGKGGRPESGRATVHSSTSREGRPESDSPKYATFIPSEDIKDEDGGKGQWGDLTERRVIITPVAPLKEAVAGNNDETQGAQVSNYEETHGAEGSNFDKTAKDIPEW